VILPDVHSSGQHVKANAPRSAWRRQGLALTEDHNRPGRTLTRASRAHSARSERSGEPCTARRRARMLPDVMAVCVNLKPDIETCIKPMPVLRWIRRRRTTARAPHRTSTPRGVNDPTDDGPGPHRPRDTGVVHAPLSAHRLGAHALGRHTAPSDLHDLDAHNLLSRSIFGPPCWRRVRAPWRRQRAWRFECWGTSSLPALVPPLTGFLAQPGKETAASSSARVSATAEHVAVLRVQWTGEAGCGRRVLQATPTKWARCKYCLWTTMNSTAARPPSN
jgi:hypothetical protein